MLNDGCSAAVALEPLQGRLDFPREFPILLYKSGLTLDGYCRLGIQSLMKPRRIGQLPTCRDVMPEGPARDVSSGFVDCKAPSTLSP